MNYLPPLEELDSDGAIREGAESVDGKTRADFLRRAGVGAGALVGGGALLGALPAIASAGVSRNDIGILNFALTLEYLEAAFYAEAVAKGKLTGETARFARVVADHERAHVSYLKSALGAKAVRKPRFNFHGATADQAKFQATARALEDTGVAAYLGQVGNIRSKGVLVAAGSILPIEARHAAWIREIIGNGHRPTPAPSAFEGARTKREILAAVKATNFIVT
jgi:rubrerythrin